MMRIPYIRVKQREEIFFFSKINAFELKSHVNFHFRDPYLTFQRPAEEEDASQYINRLTNLGLTLSSDPEGIQRRLQINRIHSIAKYVQTSVSNFFPNSIILSANVAQIDGFASTYERLESSESGYLDLPNTLKFGIIDGQHRLAGIFSCEDNIIKSFEIPVVILFDVSLSTAAKLFSDINGNQKPVNRSLIYDLLEEVESGNISRIKQLHILAQKFYTDPKSPLYKQIKMLGIGKGAVSQAFFIDNTKTAIEKTGLQDAPLQEIYTQLFFYFKAFQIAFPKDWPVPVSYQSDQELDEYSTRVLSERRSQLVKTNGFGAILRLFPDVHQKAKDSDGYNGIIRKLVGEIEWTQTTDTMHGTGKKFQDYLYRKMREILAL